MNTRVVIVGAGFAGLNAAKQLGNKKGIDVLLIDKRNHHLFQPLLYQVAMAGLSPAEIAAPIRALTADFRNIRVLMDEVASIDFGSKRVCSARTEHSYDYLILCCGVSHSYFGKPQWEQFAPGLKTLEQATEIRRRVLLAFELAESSSDREEQRQLLTFVVVGGGPTGVELAGALGEMTRFCLQKDFRSIDPSRARVILLEAGNQILSGFSDILITRAVRDLEELGVQVWTNSLVTHIDESGVSIGDERIKARTVVWAAGVAAPELSTALKVTLSRSGKVVVNEYCRLGSHEAVFVIGDQAAFADSAGKELPGMAPVAIQQGVYAAKCIQKEIAGKSVTPFRYRDKGQMATIGRSRAIAETGAFKFTGFVAWLIWLIVHIYYLIGFKNRLFVLYQWGWHYLTFKKGARLIVNRNWEQEKRQRPAQIEVD